MIKKDPVHIFVVEQGGLFKKMLEYIFTKDTRYRFLDFRNCEECLEHVHLEPHVILLDHNFRKTTAGGEIIGLKDRKPSPYLVLLLNHHTEAHPDIEKAGMDYVVKNVEDISPVIKKLEHYLSPAMMAKKYKLT
jgi:hypothetical protein